VLSGYLFAFMKSHYACNIEFCTSRCAHCFAIAYSTIIIAPINGILARINDILALINDILALFVVSLIGYRHQRAMGTPLRRVLWPCTIVYTDHIITVVGFFAIVYHHILTLLFFTIVYADHIITFFVFTMVYADHMITVLIYPPDLEEDGPSPQACNPARNCMPAVSAFIDALSFRFRHEPHNLILRIYYQYIGVQTLHPTPYTLHPPPQTPDPRPQTPDPRLHTPES